MIDTGVPTLDQTTALSQVGKAYDRFQTVVRRALRLGVTPESIIEFLDAPATQITNYTMREIVGREMIALPISIEDADTEDQEMIDTHQIRQIEADDTVKIKEFNGQ